MASVGLQASGKCQPLLFSPPLFSSASFVTSAILSLLVDALHFATLPSGSNYCSLATALDLNLCRDFPLPPGPCLQTDKLFLYEKFGPFGSVLSVKVMTDEQGACKGVGFVNFGDPESAARAVQAMNGMPLGERRLYVALQTHRNR